MIFSIGRGMSRKKCNDPSLKGVVPSCVFDVDATKFTSYPGSGQTWANIVAAPADGSAQTAYDFYIGGTGGASSDDPTFTGSAGSASAYWSFDGGDRFSLARGANTDFLNALHKTTGGTDFWIAIAFRPVITTTSGQSIFNTRNASTTNGLSFSSNSSNVFNMAQGNGSSSISKNFVTLTPGTDYVAIVSYAGGNIRSWINTATKATTTLTYGATSSNTLNAAAIGSRADAAGKVENGFRIYAVSMGNVFIDNTEAASIIHVYNTRHGRTYA